MVKLPKEVGKVIRTLEQAGFETYAVGGCVRDSLLGFSPCDWDLATAAELVKMQEIIPEAWVLSEKFGVTHVELEGGGIDIATYRTDGFYSDHRRPDDVVFISSIREDLKRRDFTINAIAYHPDRPIVDPFKGREDLQAGLIQTVGKAADRFEEDPLRILRAVRLAVELDFEIHSSVYEGILEKRNLIASLSKERIRKEFEKIIISKNSGRGLRILVDEGLIGFILGTGNDKMLSEEEKRKFNLVVENIDRTEPILDRRLGLFYPIFDEPEALNAIRFLGYSRQMEQKLTDAVRLLPEMHLLSGKHELKKFLLRYGMERYRYLDGLSASEIRVYGLEKGTSAVRAEQLQAIIAGGEPVFMEDLAVDGNDLLNQGLAEGETLGKVLMRLLDTVHRNPELNTKEELIRVAEKYIESSREIRKKEWVK